MELVQGLIKWLLYTLPVATLITILFCLGSIPIYPDEAESYKKRMWHAVYFTIAAETAMCLVLAITSYYS